MPFFAESIINRSPVSSDFGLVVRPIGDGAGGAVKVELAGGSISIGSASFASTTVVRDLSNTNWVNVGVGDENTGVLHMPVKILGTGSNAVEPTNLTPPDNAWALPVRNVGKIQTVLSDGTNQVGTLANPLVVTQSGSTGVTQVTGQVTASLNGVAQVTGSVFVINQQNVTGQVTASIPDVVRVSGSVASTIVNTVPITGSVYVINQQQQNVTGQVTASIAGVAQITGSVKISEPIIARLTGTFVQPVTGTVTLSDNAFVRSEKIENTLEDILDQLKEMNFHLRKMTGEEYED